MDRHSNYICEAGSIVDWKGYSSPIKNLNGFLKKSYLVKTISFKNESTLFKLLNLGSNNEAVTKHKEIEIYLSPDIHLLMAPNFL